MTLDSISERVRRQRKICERVETYLGLPPVLFGKLGEVVGNDPTPVLRRLTVNVFAMQLQLMKMTCGFDCPKDV